MLAQYFFGLLAEGGCTRVAAGIGVDYAEVVASVGRFGEVQPVGCFGHADAPVGLPMQANVYHRAASGVAGTHSADEIAEGIDYQTACAVGIVA